MTYTRNDIRKADQEILGIDAKDIFVPEQIDNAYREKAANASSVAEANDTYYASKRMKKDLEDYHKAIFSASGNYSGTLRDAAELILRKPWLVK